MITLLLSLLLTAPEGIPVEVKSEIKSDVPQEIKDKKWYRWTTDNFVILSIDYNQGNYLYNNIENVRKDLIAAWDFPDFKFPVECRLLCVKDPVLFDSLFRLNKSQVEIRKDSSGKVNLVVIFMLLNDTPNNTLPQPISQAYLIELSQKYHVNVPFWLYNGLPLLNRPPAKIREDLSKLTDNLSAEALFRTTNQTWNEIADKKEFDGASEALCLMLVKEFGKVKLCNYIKLNDKENVLRKVYGFRSVEEFDESFHRYVKDLRAGIDKSETPDSYLQVTK